MERVARLVGAAVREAGEFKRGAPSIVGVMLSVEPWPDERRAELVRDALIGGDAALRHVDAAARLRRFRTGRWRQSRSTCLRVKHDPR